MLVAASIPRMGPMTRGSWRITAFINLVDPITRSQGIGQVQVFGAGQYLPCGCGQPDQLAKLGITAPRSSARSSRKHGSICWTGRRRAYSSGQQFRLCGAGAGPAWSHQKNSERLWSASRRRVAWCGVRMSPESNSGRRTTPSPTTER